VSTHIEEAGGVLPHAHNLACGYRPSDRQDDEASLDERRRSAGFLSVNVRESAAESWERRGHCDGHGTRSLEATPVLGRLCGPSSQDVRE
jgi:hypothetical protein